MNEKNTKSELPRVGDRVRVTAGMSEGEVGTVIPGGGRAPNGVRMVVVDLDNHRVRYVRADWLELAR